MAGVRVQRHIRDDAQFRLGGFQGTYRALHQTVTLPGRSCVQALVLLAYDGEEGDGRDAQCYQLGRLLQQQIEGEALYARHAGDGLAAVFSLQYEYRIDEIIHRDYILPHQTAAELLLAQTTGTTGWEGGGDKLSHALPRHRERKRDGRARGRNSTHWAHAPRSSRRKKARVVARVWANRLTRLSWRSSATVAAIWGRKAGSLRRDLGLGLRSRGIR